MFIHLFVLVYLLILFYLSITVCFPCCSSCFLLILFLLNTQAMALCVSAFLNAVFTLFHCSQFSYCSLSFLCFNFSHSFTLLFLFYIFNSVVECPLLVRCVIRSIPHDGPNELFLVPASTQRKTSMCYSVCVVVPIKDPLLLIKKSSACSDGSGYPLSLSDFHIAINVLSASLNLNVSFISFYI